jgi:hypothetical protein
MKKQTSTGSGNKDKHTNTVKRQAPDMHDDPQRRQPPTPQDIARLQPMTQMQNQPDKHPGKTTNGKSGKKQ